MMQYLFTVWFLSYLSPSLSEPVAAYSHSPHNASGLLLANGRQQVKMQKERMARKMAVGHQRFMKTR
jgi:hypothetical protein